ncbi:endoplasmic reticulum vesicle transporter-domain-containing protein [Armillaria luteobubalina]|uniref:Endoplasmic reticulum vesicle transporter-domain-containing protein n=1 Tax=Armillaria luteobubalina TaxID=153913 RepID=A0AA39Q0Q6_9AGAR|nr:endoplasmic reticulum vesicle transporter-domain-containing protein [Armillaria luteobubalina]
MSSTYDEDKSLLEKLDEVVPAPLAQFDAFPKLPSSFKSRSESRGFITLFVGFLAFLLMLNDIGEFIWGWPDHEFSVDRDPSSFMNINVDMVVNMPCRYISVDLRDAIGDRLFLSGHGLRRDGTKFDVGQATKLKEHSEALSVHQAIAQSRNSRGFFDTIFRRSSTNLFKPTYNYEAHGSACRVWGTLEVKRVTANLHITTLGHGYASHEHVDHKLMNLSHVISEFSFGPHFPDMTQPLDYSFEVTHDPFVAYQYFLHVVPTTYIATRSKPLHTHQYSVTHYTRVLEHNRGTPGIFFKFDLDPMSLTIHQRTTTFAQLLIRCVGVVGGVFVCMGYAIRVTTKAVEVVAGVDDPGLVAAEASGAKIGKGLRAKWGGGEIRSRSKIVRQGSGWTMEGSPGTPSYSTFTGTPPISASNSPYLASPGFGSNPGTPSFSAPSFGPSSPRPYVVPPPPSRGMRTPSLGTESGATGSPLINTTSFSPSLPGAPTYSMFPPTPNPEAGGFPTSAPPRKLSSGPKKDD